MMPYKIFVGVLPQLTVSVTLLIGGPPLVGLGPDERTQVNVILDQVMQVLSKAEDLGRDRYVLAHKLAEVAIAQAEAGDLSAALKTTRSALFDPSWQDRIKVLLSLASAQVKSSDRSAAVATLRQAHQVALAVKYDEHAERPPLLTEIAAGQVEARDFSGARATADSISTSRAKVQAQVKIAQAEGQIGDPEVAARIFQDAINTVEAIGASKPSDPRLAYWYLSEKASALGDVGLAQARIGFRKEAASTFAQAVQIAGSMPNEVEKVKVLARLAVVQSESGDSEAALRLFQQALLIVQGLKNDSGGALQSIVYLVGKSKDDVLATTVLQKAGQLATSLKPTPVKVYTFVLIAQEHARRREQEAAAVTLENSEQVVRAIEEPYGKIFALALLASAQAKQGQSARAVATIRKALELAAATKRSLSGSSKDSLFFNLARAQAQARDFKGALQTAESLDEGYRWVAIREIAEIQGLAKEEEEALAWISSLSPPSLKAGALLGVILGILRR